MARKKAAPAKVGFATLEIAVRNGVGILALNRPEVHNAFNETMITELTEALLRLAADDGVRAIVLTGNGVTFCAGADLNWMKKMAAYSHAENLADARGLARMLQTLNDMPKPTGHGGGRDERARNSPEGQRDPGQLRHLRRAGAGCIHDRFDAEH